MRALTLIQPWAYAVTDLDKRAENRVDWRPALLRTAPDVWALHAGLKLDEDVLEDLRVRRGVPIARADILHGVITAVCTTATVVHSWDDLRATSHGADLKVTDWYFGEGAIVIGEMHKLDRPVKATGMLGFWTVPDKPRGEVIEQLSSTVVDRLKASEERDKLRTKMKR